VGARSVNGTAVEERTADDVVRALRCLDLTDPRWDETAAAADLTAAELSRAARGVPEVRRRRVLVRSALRRILGELLDVPSRAVPLRLDAAGRPHLPGHDLHVSCSASDGVALVVVARGPVGVDVQRHRDGEAAAGLDEDWLAPQELHRIHALPERWRLVAVTRCWTQKEAVLKARGTGIRHLPVDVVTPVSASGRIGRWWVAPVTVPAGYVATLASDVPLGTLVPDAAGVVPGGVR
jgi:4'-phosphopantetheinyl transferase